MGGGMPGMPEMGENDLLASNRQFNFTKMQNDIFEAVQRTNFLMDRHFMALIISELNDDPETKAMFFQTIFDKLHLNLSTIKSEKFQTAESNSEFIKILLEFDGAAEIFVNSPQFFLPNMNGSQLQKETYLGRYLSYTSLCNETRSWRESDLKYQFHKMRPEQHQKYMDQLAVKFFNLHSNVADIIKKLMKNQNCKDRVLTWMRLAISLNLEK